MIEIRTYEGDAVELCHFIQGVWRATYEGQMPFPLWDQRFFEWQLLAERPGGRDYLVVAYDGSMLIGSLLAEQFRFRLDGHEFDATTGSWFTVHPDYRHRGVAFKLFNEQRRRHLERGAVFLLGFLYMGTASSLGPKFWLRFPYTMVLEKLGFWARVFDHQAVARWELSRRDGLAARTLGLFQSRPPVPHDSEGIRPYRPGDLPACLDLVHGLLERVDMGYVWTAQRLAHQLHYRDVPRTIIAEQAGRVAGFVNYYRLDFMGRYPIAAAIIDLVAFGTLRLRECKKLLLATMGQMLDEGIKMALMLRLPCYPWQPLLATGFVPLPRALSTICIRMDPTFSLEGVKRLHVHCR
jgi:GNAT superfamily N-acetyltransferase